MAELTLLLAHLTSDALLYNYGVKKNTLLILAGATLLITFSGALTYYLTDIGCSSIPPVAVTEGSQGYRTWSGPSLTTFEHQGKKICVTDGWEPLGEAASGNGWAQFENNLTGIFIRSADFEEKKLSFVFSSYEVQLVYPKTTSAEELELYEGTVQNAFERIGKLFNDSKDRPKRTHTILVTPGIERTDGSTTPIYPDPRADLSIYVRPPTSGRGEELLIHAIAHLYNRQREDLAGYQKNQSPIPAGDFQELEASWTELIYRTSQSGRDARREYLYNIHTAVQTRNFSLLKSYPFNSSKEEFDSIRPNVTLQSGASFLEEQYTHYILGPLVMSAIEGLLIEKKATANLETILSNLHRTNENFFSALARELGESDMDMVRAWMFEGKTIPYELVQLGINSYNVR